MLAAGDKTSGNRALSFMFASQQLEDGSFPQNTQVDGKPKWTGVQMDQPGSPDRARLTSRRTKTADWCHGARVPRDQCSWTAGRTATRPHASRPHDRRADLRRRHRPPPTARTAHDERRATRWRGGRRAGSRAAERADRLKPSTRRRDQLRVSTWLPRAGPARRRSSRDDPAILEQRCTVADRSGSTGGASLAPVRLATTDGERRDGEPWSSSRTTRARTLGRAWPIFAGERGEYELLARALRGERVPADAGGAPPTTGGMLPEQVWDGRAPDRKSGFTEREGTFSADASGLDARAARPARLVGRSGRSRRASRDRRDSYASRSG